jgi:hypothetical protein
MSDTIRVNGNQYSFGSVVCKVGGERFTGFTAIDYGDKRVVAKGYGLGPAQGPRGRTRGRYETDEVKLSAHLDSGQALIDKLALLSKGGLSYGNVEFQIVVQYIELDNTPITHTLDRCRIVGVTQANAEGSEITTTDFAIDCMAIYRNKKTLFDSSKGGF